MTQRTCRECWHLRQHSEDSWCCTAPFSSAMLRFLNRVRNDFLLYSECNVDSVWVRPDDEDAAACRCFREKKP